MSLAPLNGTERAVLGDRTPDAVLASLDAYASARLGSGIERIRFRAGRIDAVWGVDLADGRAVAIKTLRAPVDLDAVTVTRDAQRKLAAAGFPAPEPLSGPDRVDGRVVVAEALLTGEAVDGRSPGVRRLLAEGLARQVDMLRAVPGLVGRVGRGPSWCRYQGGPWPTPHDPIVDFRSTPPAFAWLDRFGRDAADRILSARTGEPVVAGHADWYAGNTLVRDGALAAVFDWELVADEESVVAGFAAAGFAASSTGGGGLSTPAEATAFLADYADARGRAFSPRERAAASGAVAWILAFNARWQVGLLDQGLADHGVIRLVEQRRDEYLDLPW